MRIEAPREPRPNIQLPRFSYFIFNGADVRKNISNNITAVDTMWLVRWAEFLLLPKFINVGSLDAFSWLYRVCKCDLPGQDVILHSRKLTCYIV